MKKSMMMTIVSAALFATSAVLAAPPAAAARTKWCAHCGALGKDALSASNTRGASQTRGSRPCHHRESTAARWGNAQQPCMYCSRAA